MAATISKIPVEKIIKYLNERPPREKVMILVMVLAAALVVDNFLFVQPVWGVFSKLWPEMTSLSAQIKEFKEDRKNKGAIAQRWAETRNKLITQEKMFVETDDTPQLLESLSKSAQRSGLRIVSLKPLQTVPTETDLYWKLPIQISALAGTHEFGKFLASLEGGNIFFRITDLKIAGNMVDNRKHQIDIYLEGYQRVGSV